MKLKAFVRESPGLFIKTPKPLKELQICNNRKPAGRWKNFRLYFCSF